MFEKEADFSGIAYDKDNENFPGSPCDGLFVGQVCIGDRNAFVTF
jgi:hypothetical protein